MNPRAKWTLSTKLEVLSFLLVFYQCSAGFLTAWAMLVRPFCVVVCECGARHKTGRKLKAPPGRKLVENRRSETGTRLKFP